MYIPLEIAEEIPEAVHQIEVREKYLFKMNKCKVRSYFLTSATSYSYRSASSGSSRAARAAGYSPASSPTTVAKASANTTSQAVTTKKVPSTGISCQRR